MSDAFFSIKKSFANVRKRSDKSYSGRFFHRLFPIGGWKDYVSKIETSGKEQIKPEDTVVIPGDFSWGLGFDEALPDFKFVDAV